MRPKNSWWERSADVGWTILSAKLWAMPKSRSALRVWMVCSLSMRNFPFVFGLGSNWGVAYPFTTLRTCVNGLLNASFFVGVIPVCRSVVILAAADVVVERQ